MGGRMIALNLLEPTEHTHEALPAIAHTTRVAHTTSVSKKTCMHGYPVTESPQPYEMNVTQSSPFLFEVRFLVRRRCLDEGFRRTGDPLRKMLLGGISR